MGSFKPWRESSKGAAQRLLQAQWLGRFVQMVLPKLNEHLVHL